MPACLHHGVNTLDFLNHQKRTLHLLIIQKTWALFAALLAGPKKENMTRYVCAAALGAFIDVVNHLAAGCRATSVESTTYGLELLRIFSSPGVFCSSERRREPAFLFQMIPR